MNLYSLKKSLLTIFGDIMVSKYPMYIFYHPTTFSIKGVDTLKIMSIIKPGDILMRSYNNYIDNYFIPKGESQCSHSGIYIGGKNFQVLHAMAEGITSHYIIDFCRCDRIVILRPKQISINQTKKLLRFSRKCFKDNVQYDFNFEDDNKKYYCHEFTAMCYIHIGMYIEKVSLKTIFRTMSPKKYLADSFYLNKNFKIIFEK